jgi:hypothetical protein
MDDAGFVKGLTVFSMDIGTATGTGSAIDVRFPCA